jgi:hypothetical protein
MQINQLGLSLDSQRGMFYLAFSRVIVNNVFPDLMYFQRYGSGLPNGGVHPGSPVRAGRARRLPDRFYLSILPLAWAAGDGPRDRRCTNCSERCGAYQHRGILNTRKPE